MVLTRKRKHRDRQARCRGQPKSEPSLRSNGGPVPLASPPAHANHRPPCARHRGQATLQEQASVRGASHPRIYLRRRFMPAVHEWLKAGTGRRRPPAASGDSTRGALEIGLRKLYIITVINGAVLAGRCAPAAMAAARSRGHAGHPKQMRPKSLAGGSCRGRHWQSSRRLVQFLALQ